MANKNSSLLLLGAIIIIAFLATGGKLGGLFSAADTNIGDTGSTDTGTTDVTPTHCEGISSVKLLYDDKDAYKLGTDPGSVLTIYDPIAMTVADDATSTTGPTLTEYKALAGDNAGTPSSTYFAKELDFETGCDDIHIQPKLYKAGAPTLTFVNDNGITQNSDTNDEAMDASSSYTPELTIKAPADECSSVYGAYVVAEYDATYIKSVTPVSGLTDADVGVYIAHTTNQSESGNDFDQYKVMKYSGKLCDGAKDTVSFKVETTSSTPGEDAGNIQVYWLPINKDLNADTYALITGIYDEDNNAIYIGNTSAYYYGA
ncbi:MAG: hypothetical protein J7K29_03080 [Candidatus Cloacimonetes bacterium]|nr:hypothetical protein [Candidatus Cloacimonadota bacterium]